MPAGTAQLPSLAVRAHPFTDKTNHWGYGYIVFNYERGLVSGTTPTTFSPDPALSCAMIAAVLYREADQPDTEFEAVFTDVGGN